MRMRGTTAALLLVSSFLSSPVVYAQASGDTTATPSADDKKAASEAFREGDRAYKAGDFRGAAEHYEVAYKRAPHHSPLWNAARAWDRAGEPARAANLYAKYLREAPPNARDRNSATDSLKKLAAKLARIDVHVAKGLEDLTVDGKPIEGESVYVLPGQHVVEARSGSEHVRQSPQVDAGDAVSVALVAPAEASPTPSTTTAPTSPAPATESTSHGWSPVVVAFGGAVTAITAGLAIWSGFDTVHQREVFDASPTQDNLDSGHAKQSRTNVLIAVSCGAFALTAAAAIFLVDWHSSPSQKDKAPGANVEVGLGPQSVLVRGRF